MLNGKATIVLLTVVLIKKDIVWISKYFPEPKSSGGKVKAELDLSNYARKVYFKNATGVDTPKFAQKVDLGNWKYNVDKLDIDKSKNIPSCLNSLKSKVDKLDVDKLVPAPVDLIKLSNAVKNDVVKKMYIMLR